MKKKRIIIISLIAILLAAVALIIVFAVRCSKDDEPDEKTELPIEYAVSLDVASLDLMLGDTDVLYATISPVGKGELAFTSSDETVVTVDAYGRLTARNAGEATITATYGDQSATCLVTVTLGGMSPLFQFNSIPAESITLSMTDFVDLSGKVLFNGKTFDDVTVEYALSDTSFGRIEDGAFYPAKTGTVDIYATATWRGNTGETLTERVTVTVLPQLVLHVNGGVSEITLYTRDEAAQPFTVTANYNGESVAATVEIESGEEYITLDTEAGTIEGNGIAGEAVVSVSVAADGQEYKLTLPVTVAQTIYTYETTLTDFSVMHGDTVRGTTLSRVFGGETIVKVYDDSGAEYEVRDNKVYGLPSSKTGKFTHSLTVCTAEYGYELNVEGYTGIIAKASDLAYFDINVGYYSGLGSFYAVDESRPMQVWDGYYVLMRSIDASEYTHKANGENLTGVGLQYSYPYGLTGTFDGQGFTVQGMTVGQYGLFGYVDGGTVKNVAFTNVRLNVSENYLATLAAWMNEATLQNVYISIASQGRINKYAAVVAMGVNNSSLSNCIFEMPETTTIATTRTCYGSLFGRYNELMKNSKASSRYTNVYVLSSTYVGYLKANETITETVKETVTDETTGESTEVDVTIEYKKYTEHVITAENKPLQLTLPEGETEKTWAIHTYTLEGVRQYATADEMRADTTNNYASFKAAYWTISNGIPVWKTKTIGQYVEDFNPDWL